MRKQTGFNLIELMIVVAIIGLLGSIGYSSYVGYMVEARRGTAISTILQLAQSQEKYFLDNNKYTASEATLGQSTTSTDGNYTIAVTTQNSHQKYLIKATAITGKAQASDTGCTALSLNSANERTPTDCW